MISDTQSVFPIAEDYTPSDLGLTPGQCLGHLECPGRVDVRDVVHTWCLHWGFTGRDYTDIMRPYITGQWRDFDGLSSPLWRGMAKKTGRELFDCEVSEHILAYHPVANAHDKDFANQTGFLGSNWRFYRRAARCEFGEVRAALMYTAVNTFGFPIYMRHKLRRSRERRQGNRINTGRRGRRRIWGRRRGR